MTTATLNTVAIAKDALRQIQRAPKGSVYASRRGVVAGIHRYSQATDVFFRRVNGAVRLELWQWQHHGAVVETEVLSPELERRAARMLDSL
jgi:hypothetical protein